MKLHLAAVGCFVALTLPSVAFAHDNGLAPVETEETTTEATGPSMAMVGSGLVIFGLSYVPAMVVASTSALDADRTLFVPIAGPWIDLTQRPGCGPTESCNSENTAKVFLVADGVFQAIGAVTIVGGLLTTSHETRTVRSAKPGPAVHVSPAQMGNGGYGVAATGTF
jgi:hypothetical protein